MYNPLGRDDGANDRQHAVEDMTWSRNTRNHLRTSMLGLGLGLDSLETLRGHRQLHQGKPRQEGSHLAASKHTRRIDRENMTC